MYYLPTFYEDRTEIIGNAVYNIGNGPIDAYFRDIAIGAYEWVSSYEGNNGSCSRVVLDDEDRLALGMLAAVNLTRRYVWGEGFQWDDMEPDSEGEGWTFDDYAADQWAHVFVDSSGFAYPETFSDEQAERAGWEGWVEWEREQNACDCSDCQTTLSTMDDTSEHYCTADDCDCSRVARERRRRGDYPGGLLDEVRQAENQLGTE